MLTHSEEMPFECNLCKYIHNENPRGSPLILNKDKTKSRQTCINMKQGIKSLLLLKHEKCDVMFKRSCVVCILDSTSVSDKEPDILDSTSVSDKEPQKTIILFLLRLIITVSCSIVVIRHGRTRRGSKRDVDAKHVLTCYECSV